MIDANALVNGVIIFVAVCAVVALAISTKRGRAVLSLVGVAVTIPLMLCVMYGLWLWLGWWAILAAAVLVGINSAKNPLDKNQKTP